MAAVLPVNWWRPGHYSDFGNMNVKGSFTAEMDAKKDKVTNVKFNWRDMNFLVKGLSEKESAKVEKYRLSEKAYSQTSFALGDLIFYRDGSYILLDEPFYFDYVRRGKQQTGYYTVYRYQIGNIWFLNHDKSGVVAGETKVIRERNVKDGIVMNASYGVKFSDD